MIALIPARYGSKGVPRKNIRRLGGRPLILWTIEAAMKATKIDKVILSTDDKEIADVCRPTGIEIPFMRPKELAQDDSLAIDCYIYTMGRLINEFNYDKDEFAVLLPTVPFRTAYDIDNSIKLFEEKQADSVVSCAPLTHPIDWVCKVNSDGRIERHNNVEDNKMMNRQAVEPLYIPNGGVYVFRYSILRRANSYYSSNSYAYVMPAERSIDIDTEFDFEFAEYQISKVRHGA